MSADDRPIDADDEELDDALDDEEDAPLESPAPGDGEDIPQDMVVLLEATADLDKPVEVVTGPTGTTYQLGERPFAWAQGLAFEVQLGSDIASAALRTPDVSPSARGPGWIRLEPAVIDDHAADRMVSWFELARRIAAGRQARPSGSSRH
jgi:hypothetical protein